ncbi:murein L,D-transpeptidase catalytic domain family protein [Runella sp. MFBS21]|uniref:murein L,D-transpeptidase catalytic domain family protein n=1 Tax=Runella sp. MFBS21 TaxID=3034018 RepID=UPI0023F90C12|nr:murein L,D-transpeptidase catalytic domain family protein [Runella sp. MFBS21]MDF7817145.1 murein L,D-transpeptidase catalytic domain family protein [Runella sp. MFBS21]
MKKLVMLVSVGALLLIALVGFQKKDSPFYLSLTSADSANDSASVHFKHKIVSLPEWQTLYDSLHLQEAGLSLDGFRFAWNGFQKAKFEKPVLAIADFSQSSRQKRLYVIDIKARKLIYNTYVAHGRNSGEEYARKFSNQNSSYQSSLGFYRALTTYQGKHGLSLRLQGLEENINHRAYERAIVMHGADYVSEEFIRRTGRLGRSQGCPAVSVADTPKLISLLSNGAGLFLYYPDIAYLKKSKMIGMFRNDS